VAHHPTNGLDLKAASYTHRLLQELKSAGSAILLVSEDLDEVIEVSDRVAVMCEGRFTGLLEGEQIGRETVGRLMVGG
jgi:simple sugar transport system ATP-binding protein